LNGPALLEHWRSRYESLVSVLAALGTDRR
jgi:hypothetical protein